MSLKLEYKCTIWCKIDMDDTIKRKDVIQQLKDGINPASIFYEGCEWAFLFDSETYMKPSENGGYETIELSDESGKVIWNNKEDTSFHAELDRFCKKHDIDEMNFTVKKNTDEDNPSFYYCNLDDNEYQFGETGDIPTNYKTK